MSYLVLARKYRPQRFGDVVGQEHVTRTLANALASGRVAHAYLFCGPRGVGKTTAARILAKALNCDGGPNQDPCNACESCREITAGNSLDVLEIDGASNRGINEVRELRENTRYAPAGGRSKIYIIDEAHMLTNEAFNALLKTLEEPPAHVVFVLATTEPFKMPPTILSRCQRFDFARIPGRSIAEHLGRLMGEEEIEADPEAIALVARRARGGLRDALSLMDQIIAAVDGPVDRPAVERILGLVGTELYSALVDAIAAEDASAALRHLHTIYSQGGDLRELAEGLAAHLRDLLLLRLGDDLADLTEAPESDVPELSARARQFSADALAELVERAASIAVELRRSEHPLLVMELALAEMCAVAGRIPLAELAERLLALEQQLGGGGPPADRPRAPGTKAAPRRAAPRPASKPGGDTAKSTATAPPGAGVPASEAAVMWGQCLDALRERSMRLWGTFHNATAVDLDADGALVIRPQGAGPLLSAALADATTREAFREILKGLGAAHPEVRLQGTVPAAARAPAKSAGSAARAESAGSAPAESAAEVPAPVAEPSEGSGSAEEPAPNAAAERAQPDPAKPSARPKPRAKADDKPADDTRSMGQIFKEEPLLQKALDMFDGEVLP
jgi:DNA polymerase-3 subunit gamma/tau